MSKIVSDMVEIRSKRILRILSVNNPHQTKTLFFLHGLGGHAEQWQAEIDFFKENYNIVAPDYLGHGKSHKPEKEANKLYSFHEMALDAQIIFDRYATEENYLIGHSYGGALAAQLSLNNPEKINKLILVAPVVLKPYRDLPKVYLLPIFILEWMRPLLIKQFVKLAFNPNTDRQLIDKEIEIGRTNSLYVIRSIASGMRNIPEEDSTQIKQPTLIITVDDDRLTPAKYIQQCYKNLPRVEFKKIEGAGHMVIIEQPQKLNHLIKNFIES